MAELITLSEADVRVLKDSIEKLKKLNNNPPLRPYVEPIYTPSSEVLVALTPDSGIPAISGYLPGGGIECSTFKYRESDVTSVLEDTGALKVVYNLYDEEIPANTWILIAKDKYGVWYVTSRFTTSTTVDPTPGTGTTTGTGSAGTGTGVVGTGTGVVGTGTNVGTGSGTTTSCTPIDIVETDILCIAGVLQVWNRTVSLNVVDGCLTKTEGEWTHVRDEGCCECTPGTGTSSGSLTTGTGTYTGTATSSSSGSLYNTVTVDCCVNPLPETLYATITDKTGDCTCLPNSFTLTWNGMMWANNSIATSCTFSMDFSLSCLLSTFSLMSTMCGTGANPNSAICSPLQLVWTGLTCPALCSGTFTITITE